LVNAYTVKKHREGRQLDRSKDDARDAYAIADVLRSGWHTHTRLLRGGYAQLRQYAVLYDRLKKDIRRQKNLIHPMVGQLFPELRHIFKDLAGETASALLKRHGAAAKIRQMSCADFIAAVRADLDGSRLLVSRLRRVHALAKRSVGLAEGATALQLTLRFHIETLESLRTRLETVRQRLLDTFLGLPESRYWLSIHDLGAVTAAIILAEIGDPSHYRHAGQWVKLAGTQPVPNTSGRKSRSRTPMSRKGRPRLRTCLLFAVMRLVQNDPGFAREYQRFQQRPQNPLAPMQALGAMMNRLLRILWALVRHERLYDPNYQPIV
jgi:transposase